MKLGILKLEYVILIVVLNNILGHGGNGMEICNAMVKLRGPKERPHKSMFSS